MNGGLSTTSIFLQANAGGQEHASMRLVLDSKQSMPQTKFILFINTLLLQDLASQGFFYEQTVQNAKHDVMKHTMCC